MRLEEPAVHDDTGAPILAAAPGVDLAREQDARGQN